MDVNQNEALVSRIFGEETEEIAVILHGLFGSGKNWTSIAREISRRKQSFLLDLRNHGDSFSSEKMDYESMAEDVASFLRKFEEKKIEGGNNVVISLR